MRPVLRFCLKRSYKFQELVRVAKEEFLEMAFEELGREEASVSKLSAVTGLQRKDIHQLIHGKERNGGVNVVTRIVGHWIHSRKFSKSPGKARPLDYLGAESEFAELVRSVSSDLSHHTLLKEMERLGVVKRGKSAVTLLRTEVPLKGEEGYLAAADDIDDLFRAADENLSDDVRHLHARTAYDSIPTSALPKIRKWLFSMGERIHAEARRELSKFDRDYSGESKDGDEVRVTLGTFSFVEPAVKDEKGDESENI